MNEEERNKNYNKEWRLRNSKEGNKMKKEK